RHDLARGDRRGTRAHRSPAVPGDDASRELCAGECLNLRRPAMSQRVRLVRHGTSDAAPITAIEVEAGRRRSVLALTYVVVGDISDVCLPQRMIPARADALWQHTCFEAFVRHPCASSYWELNLSPSLQWAAYRFHGYRGGLAIESGISDPRLDMQATDSEIRFSALVDLSRI